MAYSARGLLRTAYSAWPTPHVAYSARIILGVACGTMGGYPHVAHVISADLDRLGQLKSGDMIRFELVTIDLARRVLKDMHNQRRALFRRVSLMSEVD
jgi:allophanate hydrolase subunit 2